MIASIHSVLGARQRKDRVILISDSSDFDSDFCNSSSSGGGGGSKSVAAPRSFVFLLLQQLFIVFQTIFQTMLDCTVWFLGAVEDVARFVFILFGVIPWLTCMFVVLSVTFHIPRIFLTYACRPVMWFCWKHVCMRM